jgi:hypothetical protein
VEAKSDSVEGKAFSFSPNFAPQRIFSSWTFDMVLKSTIKDSEVRSDQIRFCDKKEVLLSFETLKKGKSISVTV